MRWALRSERPGALHRPAGARSRCAPPDGATSRRPRPAAEAPSRESVELRRERIPSRPGRSVAGYADGEAGGRRHRADRAGTDVRRDRRRDDRAARRPRRACAGARSGARSAHAPRSPQAVKEIDGADRGGLRRLARPGLTAERSRQATDRALLKAAQAQGRGHLGAVDRSRLAIGIGYGAGVAAPGWYAHCGERRGDRLRQRWLARIAGVLRDEGPLASPASLIEAARLAATLAAMRGRATPGSPRCTTRRSPPLPRRPDPLRIDRARAAARRRVGAIPTTCRGAAARICSASRSALRLKPEALEREIAVDLRTESGLDRSTLLHRLNCRRALGPSVDAGGARHVPRALAAALGAGIRGAARREADLRVTVEQAAAAGGSRRVDEARRSRCARRAGCGACSPTCPRPRALASALSSAPRSSRRLPRAAAPVPPLANLATLRRDRAEDPRPARRHARPPRRRGSARRCRRLPGLDASPRRARCADASWRPTRPSRSIGDRRVRETWRARCATLADAAHVDAAGRRAARCACSTSRRR